MSAAQLAPTPTLANLKIAYILFVTYFRLVFLVCIMPYQEVARCWEHKRIVSKIETWPMLFFKVITKSAVKHITRGRYDFALEFPLGFVEEYAREFGQLTLVTLAFSDRVWPVVMRERDMGRAAKRVFMYGIDRWRKFFEEEVFMYGSDTKEGDTLVFMLIERSRFMVFIFPMCSRCTSGIDMQERIASRR